MQVLIYFRMDKINLDNFYNKISKTKEYEVFSFTLPITIMHKKMHQQTENFLKDNYDLLTSDIDVLAALYFNGSQLTPTKLYAATVFSSGGMTKILKKLEDKELINRTASSIDKRSMLVCLTQKGEQLIQESLNTIAKSKEDMFNSLNKKEKDDFKRILSKITYSLLVK